MNIAIVDTSQGAPGFLEEVEARGRALGALVGARYGEGFRVRGPVPIEDARALLPAAEREDA